MRRSEQISTLANKYLLKSFVADKKGKIPFLDIFQGYKDFVLTEAVGYGLEANEFQKVILERFPAAKMDDNISVVGIKTRVYEPVVIVPRDPFTLKMERRVSDMLHDKPSFRNDGFTTEILLIFNEEIIDAVKAENWLKDSDSFYFQKRRWHKENI